MNKRFEALAPNSENLKQDKKYSIKQDKKTRNDKNFQKDMSSQKTNIFKPEKTNTRFDFTDINFIENNNNLKSQNYFDNDEPNTKNLFRPKKRFNNHRESGSGNSFRKKYDTNGNRGNSNRGSSEFFDRKKYLKELEQKKREEEAAKNFTMDINDFPSL